MNKSTLLGTITAYLLVASLSVNAASFSIPFGISYPEKGAAYGLAVNPANENIIITSTSPPDSLPPGGADNLWVFSSSGYLLDSNRTIFDVGDSGWLGSATFGNEGKLFIHASYAGLSPLFVTTDVVEMSQDGYTIHSAFSLDQYIDPEYFYYTPALITYNSIDDLLIVYALDFTTREYVLREFKTDGTLLHTSNVDAKLATKDLAFDMATGNLFSLRADTRFALLDEFKRTSQGGYQLVNTYDMASTGIPGDGSAMDISRSTGLFYMVADNGRKVFVFDRSELVSVPTYTPGDSSYSDPVRRVTTIEGCGEPKEVVKGSFGVYFSLPNTFTLHDRVNDRNLRTYSGEYEWVTEGTTVSLSLNKSSRKRLWRHIKSTASSLCRADGKIKPRKIKKLIIKYDRPYGDATETKLIAKFKFRDSTGVRKGTYKVIKKADN
jgi:hypothetical protein